MNTETIKEGVVSLSSGRKDSMGRRIPIRTPEWRENIGNALRTGADKVCPCGKTFFVHPYRFEEAKYCSPKCFGVYHEHIGSTKGKKVPKGSIAKLGEKNPMYGKKLSAYQRESLMNGVKKYHDTIRVSKEWKKLVKMTCNFRREALKKKLGGSFSVEEWLQVIADQEGRCAKCLKTEPEIKLTVDHIIPLTKWEKWSEENPVSYLCNDIQNIQALCLKCNVSKGNRI